MTLSKEAIGPINSIFLAADFTSKFLLHRHVHCTRHLATGTSLRISGSRTAVGFACSLGSHTISLTAFCIGRRVRRLSSACLFRVRSRRLSEIGAKFRRLFRKSGSPSKNMTLDFAPEVAEYPESSPKPQNSPKWDLECASLLFRSARCSLF